MVRAAIKRDFNSQKMKRLYPADAEGQGLDRHVPQACSKEESQDLPEMILVALSGADGSNDLSKEWKQVDGSQRLCLTV